MKTQCTNRYTTRPCFYFIRKITFLQYVIENPGQEPGVLRMFRIGEAQKKSVQGCNLGSF